MTPQQHLEVQAYRLGFFHGSDPSGARRRHRIEPATDAAWRRGYQAGQQSAAEAAEAFRAELEGAGDAPTPCPKCGAQSQPSARVPAMTCPACGCVFRPTSATPPPRIKGGR